MASNRADRERLILQYIVQYFIDTGTPVGSRSISKKLPLDLSSATIRNIMADLEDQGLLQHPHTSAGRIPTDKGYRVFVDDLVTEQALSRADASDLRETLGEMKRRIHRISDGIDEILFYSSRALARISNELGLILSPRFNQCVLEKLALTAVSPEKILVEINLRTGIIKSLILEVHAKLESEELQTIQRSLNERLAGLSVLEIRKTLADRVADLPYRLEDREEQFLRVFVDESERLFNFEDGMQLMFAGANNILAKPDLQYSRDAFSLIEMLEEREKMVQLLSARPLTGLSVTIGEEHDRDDLNGVTIVTAPYTIGGVTGAVGIVGPKRMPYARIIPLVRHTAQLLEKTLNENPMEN